MNLVRSKEIQDYDSHVTLVLVSMYSATTILSNIQLFLSLDKLKHTLKSIEILTFFSPLDTGSGDDGRVEDEEAEVSG